MKIAQGFARKISLCFIGISFIGWIVFTAGFGEMNKGIKQIDSSYNPGKESSLYAFWAGSVTGPFVHILAIAHVLLWGLLSSIAGSVTAVLSIMYLSAVAYGMVAGGIFINQDLDEYSPASIERAYKLLFGGGLITTFFWAVHLAFWPWFKKEEGPRGEGFATF